MDPIANLKEQLELANKLLDETIPDDQLSMADACRLAELVLALDEWRRKGGFDPYLTPAV